MGAVDVTDRLDEIGRRIVGWDFPGARDAAQRLLDEPGLSDDDRLTARRLLAEVLRELGELDAAYDLADAVAAQAERRYGPAHRSTVHAVAVLAAVRHDHDEWDEAERLYHRVLDSGIDEDGAEPVCRAVRLARVNLALLQRDRGETALALSMLNAAYVLHRREYGADDLDTIRIAAELAALQHAEGDVVAARRLFTLAHAAARARLGTRHPFTKAVEWELAAVEPPMPSAPVSSPPVRDSAPTVVDSAVDPVVDQISPEPSVPPEPPPPDSRPPRPVRSVWPLLSVVVVVLGAAVLAVLLVWHRPARAPSPQAANSPAAGGTAVSSPAATGAAGTLPAAVASPPSSSVAVASPPSSPAAVVVRDLRLRDGRTELTVTWTALPVTVVVALSRAEAPAVVVTTVPPGTARYVIRGVDPGVPYCVVVGPVDEAVALTPATSVCTGDR
ncbi:tetratricopeptide repeat protein [Dactylosporangium sp. NPDC051484]|uniref:tetratricopeptide repeat protein n=1 Tax=Dactylosporangium sp. NPDC051484 TaxID=3154942 RepID=UPI00344FD2F5